MFKKILFAFCLSGCFTLGFAQDPVATPAETPAETPTETPAETAAANTGTVSRAQFTSQIKEREPADSLAEADTNTQRLYFFTELSNMQGQTVTHRWSFLGEKMAEVNFNVGGNRWRVWSSKQMMPHWLGDWKAEVIAADGSVLATQTLKYSAAPEPSATAAKPEQNETTNAQ